MERLRGRTHRVRAVDQLLAESPGRVRAARSQSQPSAGGPGRPSAMVDRQRAGPQSQRADLDHRARPIRPAPDIGMGLEQGLAAEAPRAGLADERIPQPLPHRVRAGPATRQLAMSRTVWTWGRFAGSALVLSVLVWRLGASPFLEGVRTINAGALAAAAGLGVLTTVCCAWRWKIVAGGLGVDLPLPAAVAAYYRALFLNLTLPGGIVGDVHRGVSHGRRVSDVGRALRAVAWERFAGQVVLFVLALVVLLALPSPVHASMPLVAIAVVAAVPCAVLVGPEVPGGRALWAVRAGQ